MYCCSWLFLWHSLFLASQISIFYQSWSLLHPSNLLYLKSLLCLLCESAQASSWDNHKPMPKAQGVNLFPLRQYWGVPEAKPGQRQTHTPLNSVHARGLPACCSHLFIKGYFQRQNHLSIFTVPLASHP